MKKLFFLSLLCVILVTSIMPANAQYDDILIDNLPENIAKEVRQSKGDIKVIDNAKFMIGDTLYVDVSKFEEENEEDNESSVAPFESKMPVNAQSDDILIDNLPENIVKEVEQSKEDIKVIDNAKFMIGDTLYVDVSKFEEENEEDNESSVAPFESKMPTKTWNWNKGVYEAEYSIRYERTYSQYNFTGYDQYYVKAVEEHRDHLTNKGRFDVLLMTGKNKGYVVTASKVTDGSANIRFYNCKPGTKYAIAIEKANDGSIAEGWIRVSR